MTLAGWRDAASVSVSDAFVDGGEGLIVLVVEDGSGFLKVEFLRFRHEFIVARISDRCNEKCCPPQHRSHPFAKGAKGWGPRQLHRNYASL